VASTSASHSGSAGRGRSTIKSPLPFGLPRDQRLHIGQLELRFCRWLAGMVRCTFACHGFLRLPRNCAQPVGAGAVLRFQQHDDELLRRLVLSHHTTGVLVAQFFDLILGKVPEGVACAGHRLARGVDDDSTAPGVLERDGGDRREHVEVFGDPAEIGLALSLCPGWYVAVFGCHTM